MGREPGLARLLESERLEQERRSLRLAGALAALDARSRARLLLEFELPRGTFRDRRAARAAARCVEPGRGRRGLMAPRGLQYSARDFPAGPALENPGQQRRRLSRRGSAAPRRCAASAGRGHGRRSRSQPQRRQQFAHARRAGARVLVRRAHVLRQRHADRLRAPRDLGAVRLRARHGRLRHQRRRQPRRRRALFRHGRGRDRGPLPRPADDGGVAGRARGRHFDDGGAGRERAGGAAAAQPAATAR